MAQDRITGLETSEDYISDEAFIREAELQLEQVDVRSDESATVSQLVSKQRHWRYGHVIVDEAQDLSAMAWRMVARRAEAGSMTIVGDVAQRTASDQKTWDDILGDVSPDFSYRELTINYRSPREVNEVATTILKKLAPSLQPSQAIRSSNIPVEFIAVRKEEQAQHVKKLTSASFDGREIDGKAVGSRAVVISADGKAGTDCGAETFTPQQVKGLEFDDVIIVEPQHVLDLPGGLSLLYVAITRATSKLTIIHSGDLPDVLKY